MNGDMCPFLLFCFVFILLFWVCFFDSFRCVTALPTLEPALADFELTEICLRSAGIRSICHHRPARLLVSKMFSHIYIPNTVSSPSIPCAPNTVHFSSPQDPFLLSFLSERSKYPSNINQTCRVSLYDQVPICACYHCFLVYMCFLLMSIHGFVSLVVSSPLVLMLSFYLLFLQGFLNSEGAGLMETSFWDPSVRGSLILCIIAICESLYFSNLLQWEASLMMATQGIEIWG